MFLRSLGLALALNVCLVATALAETRPSVEKYGPPAPTSTSIVVPKPLLGSEVPQFGALAQKTGFSLAAITLLFLLATGTIKRFTMKRGVSKSDLEIEILAKKALGPRQALLVASLNGRKFFLAQGPEQVTLLSSLDEDLVFASDLDESFESAAAPKTVNFGK